jgi:hypothetical protein
MRTRLFGLAVVVTLLLGGADQLGAITFGFVDSTNAYPNAGAFIVKNPEDNLVFPICSGTLIDSGVFLTASHCTAFFEQVLEPAGYEAFISFDGSIPWGEETDLSTTTLIPVIDVVTNERFTQAQNDPGDVAVLLVDPGDTLGIPRALLPPAGFFEEIANRSLRNAVVTNVGYGVQDRVVGGGVPFFNDANPVPRMYSFSSFNALNKGYIRYSQNPATGDGGSCFGDSGGPQFLDYQGTVYIVSITIRGDSVCRATNVAYRLDTESARDFLAPYVSAF